jgi:hypothetical protein
MFAEFYEATFTVVKDLQASVFADGGDAFFDGD